MTPGIRILVSGKDITQDVTARNGVVEWSDGVDESADPFAITLQDTDSTLEIPKAGVKVEIMAGYDGQLSRIGSFTVDEVEVSGPPDSITVSGSSAPVLASSGIASRKSFTWENTTLGAIAKKVAANLSLTASVDATLGATAITSEQQTNESESNFLLKLARRYGGYVKFADGRLVIAKEGEGKTVSGTSANVSLTKNDVTKWRMRAGGKQQSYKRVKTRTHDYGKAATVEKVIEVPASKTVGQFGVSQASTGTYTPVDFDGANPFGNAGAAEAAGNTTAKRLARASRSLSLSMPGRVGIIAGGKVTLTDFRSGVAGEWLVKKCQHRISAANGWTVDVDCEGVN